MEKTITIPIWQLEDIENTLRMCSNTLESHAKKTCLDRCICKSWEFAKSALAKPSIETPTNAPLVDVSGLLPDQEKIKAMASDNADKWEKYGYSRGNLYDYFIMGAEAVVEFIKGNNR